MSTVEVCTYVEVSIDEFSDKQIMGAAKKIAYEELPVFSSEEKFLLIEACDEKILRLREVNKISEAVRIEEIVDRLRAWW